MAAFLFSYIIDILDDLPSFLYDYLEEREISIHEFLLWLTFYSILSYCIVQIYFIMKIYIFSKTESTCIDTNTTDLKSMASVNYASLVNPILKWINSQADSNKWLDDLNSKLNSTLQEHDGRWSVFLKCQNVADILPTLKTMTLTEKPSRSPNSPNGEIPGLKLSGDTLSSLSSSSSRANLIIHAHLQESKLRFTLNVEKKTSRRVHKFYYDVDVLLESSVVMKTFWDTNKVSSSIKVFPKVKILSLRPNSSDKYMEEGEKRMVKKALQSSLLSTNGEIVKYLLTMIAKYFYSANYEINDLPVRIADDLSFLISDESAPISLRGNEFNQSETDSPRRSSNSSPEVREEKKHNNDDPSSSQPIRDRPFVSRNISMDLAWVRDLGTPSVEQPNLNSLFPSSSEINPRPKVSSRRQSFLTDLPESNTEELWDKSSVKEIAPTNCSVEESSKLFPVKHPSQHSMCYIEQMGKSKLGKSGNYKEITMTVQAVKFTMDQSLLSLYFSPQPNEPSLSESQEKIKLLVQMELNAPHFSPKTNSVELKSNGCVFWEESRQFLLTDKSNTLKVKLVRGVSCSSLSDEPEEVLGEGSLDILEAQHKYFRGSRQFMSLLPCENLQSKGITSVGIITLECSFKDQNWCSNSLRGTSRNGESPPDLKQHDFPDVIQISTDLSMTCRAVPAKGRISPDILISQIDGELNSDTEQVWSAVANNSHGMSDGKDSCDCITQETDPTNKDLKKRRSSKLWLKLPKRFSFNRHRHEKGGVSTNGANNSKSHDSIPYEETDI